jgi:hypothetical protein
MSVWKILAYAVGAAIVGTVVFVRAGQLGGQSGGAQASSIINSTTKGAASIINAAEGFQGAA